MTAAVARVVELDDGQADAVVELLAGAFADDPGFHRTFPRERARARWMRRMFRGTAEICFRLGAVLGVLSPEGELVATALWLPPELAWPIPWYSTLKQSARLLPLVFYPATQSRLAREQRVIRRSRPRALGRAAYLAGLAVMEAHRDRGLGSVLLRECMQRAESRGASLFLHAWTGRLSFYEQHGFQVAPRELLREARESMHVLVWAPCGHEPIDLDEPEPKESFLHREVPNRFYGAAAGVSLAVLCGSVAMLVMPAANTSSPMVLEVAGFVTMIPAALSCAVCGVVYLRRQPRTVLLTLVAWGSVVAGSLVVLSPVVATLAAVVAKVIGG